MRIAIFHNLLSGGGKRALHELARRLAQQHELRVYSLASANHSFADVRPLAATHQVFDFSPSRLWHSPLGRVNQVARMWDLLRLRALSRRVAAAIERDGADVAFVHPCQFENSPSLLRALRQVPTVYYCQEPLRRWVEPMPARPYFRPSSAQALLDRVDPALHAYHRLMRHTDRANLRAAGRVLVNSEFVRQAVRHLYGVEAQVSYLGVDTALFRPLAAEKQPFLLSVGSLTPLKGFDFLIEALGELPPAQRRPLVIVSNFQNPPERAHLTALAAERGVTLELMANVSDEQLVTLYNQAPMAVYAPIREPFGLVPLEALACATPVVAVREGGLAESVEHGRFGLLTDRHPGRFAEAVARLLGQPEVARNYGSLGREHVAREWSWERAAGRVEAALAGGAA
jgi:glycosyltransferase involved in cell wall biosynthesis